MASKKRLVYDEKAVDGEPKRSFRIADEADAPSLTSLSLLDLISERKRLVEVEAALEQSKRAVFEAFTQKNTTDRLCCNCRVKLTDTTIYRFYPISPDDWWTCLCATCYRLPEYVTKPYRSNDDSIYFILESIEAKPKQLRLDFQTMPSPMDVVELVAKLAPRVQEVRLFGRPLTILSKPFHAMNDGKGYQGNLSCITL